MCTAIYYKSDSTYFGRNLDLEYHYDERVVITPRNFSFNYKYNKPDKQHFAIIGIATVIDGFPLYYDAVNEHGLGMAGLNFVGNCIFNNFNEEKNNLAIFEIIPYILAKCKTVDEAEKLLANANLTKDKFNDSLPPAELHFMICDKERAITAEPGNNRFNIYKNEIGVLANNPPFPEQLSELEKYLHLSAEDPNELFCSKIKLSLTSHGMGAIGLPGDLSSRSRFIRSAFTLLNSPKKESKTDSLSQFFHILETVYQTEGCVKKEDKYIKTQYSSCMDLSTGDYYFKTYSNSRISRVRPENEYLSDSTLKEFPVFLPEDICSLN